jgi:hypothetical protein
LVVETSVGRAVYGKGWTGKPAECATERYQ